MAPEDGKTLLIDKRLTLNDWIGKYPQISPQQITQIYDSYRGARIPDLVDACIEGNLRAIMAGTYTPSKIKTTPE